MKILILEDNKFDSDLAKRHILKDIPTCEIEIATSIEEANNYINGDYDLALLDIKLPDGFGTDFLMKLRKENKKIAIIMLSGLEDDEFIVTALKSGADDFIVKKEGYLSNLSDIILYNLSEKSRRNERSLERINVLYLEHHSTDIDLTVRHFKRVAPQFQFQHTTSAENVLEQLKNWVFETDKCTILLMDYNMPGINAIELTKIIRQELKLDIPIVIVTGHGSEDIAIEALKLGADEYLVKRENYLNRLPYLLINAYQRCVLEHRKKALVKSESKYRLLFENNPQPMFIYDLETLEFLEVNKAAITHYGYSNAEFLSMNIEDIQPDNAPKAVSKETYCLETTHRTKDGGLIFVEISAHAIEFNGKQARHLQIKDVTKRKEAEKQVQLLSTSVEQSPVSIIITDFEGVIEYANPRFVEISGYSPDEIIGNNPRIVASGYQSKAFYETLWETIKSGRIWQGEFANKRKSGEIFWENAVIAPIKQPGGAISHFVSVKEDITARKKMIEELIVAKERAEESDRLKSIFLSTMSHELRTPLNALIGFSSLMEPTLPMNDIMEFSKNINQSGLQLLHLIEHIFNISNIEAGITKLTKKEFDLAEMMNYLIKLTQNEKIKYNKEQVEIVSKSQLGTRHIKLFSDRNIIQQIFINLLVNAIKFTDSGSIEFGYTVENKRNLKFYVKDTGIGIPIEKQIVIFEKFRQIEESDTREYGGVGLGLTIARSLVELLGGQIWIKSELGKGATFFVRLPDVISEAEPEVEVQKKAPVKYDFSKNCILVVEDEITSYQYISHLLKPTGVKLLWARDGREAIDMTSEYPDIDLILMDLRIPFMDGFQASKEIIFMKPESKIVVLSAYADESNKQKAKRIGCDDFFSKPFIAEDLLERITEILDR